MRLFSRIKSLRTLSSFVPVRPVLLGPVLVREVVQWVVAAFCCVPAADACAQMPETARHVVDTSRSADDGFDVG